MRAAGESNIADDHLHGVRNDPHDQKINSLKMLAARDPRMSRNSGR